MNRALDVSMSIAASLVRGFSGMRVGSPGSRPKQPLELYDFEGCPFCRKVREALSILDLEAIVYPCPRNGPRFREEVKARGGKYQFPYLVDPNTGVEQYESDAIVGYLFENYGDGRVPGLLAGGLLTDASAMLATALRPGRGIRYRRARAPEKPLELWSFEASPYCRIVRETLSSFEIPYLLHNVAMASPSREHFRERAGKVLVPYLVDPNTGVEMFESAEIRTYLEETYGGAAH